MKVSLRSANWRHGVAELSQPSHHKPSVRCCWPNFIPPRGLATINDPGFFCYTKAWLY